MTTTAIPKPSFPAIDGKTSWLLKTDAFSLFQQGIRVAKFILGTYNIISTLYANEVPRICIDKKMEYRIVAFDQLASGGKADFSYHHNKIVITDAIGTLQQDLVYERLYYQAI